ncbi:MAG: DUF1697 domain-containing protein [Thermoleophilaceae bacterium]|nr:DUF1697 domain-containing protein [Thermoleophilaceae bacterium]
MARFAALLRGVNVGPTTRVPMAELRELLEELGGSDVATLLNSGNAVLQIHASPKSIDGILSAAMTERFGFRVDVVTRTKRQLEAVLAHDPFGDLVTDESKSFVYFMPTPPRAAAIRPVLAAEYPDGELCELKGREFYLWSPSGGAKSKAAEALKRSKAVEFSTARNVRTLRKILEIL